MDEKMDASTASLPLETPKLGASTELIAQVESVMDFLNYLLTMV
jgi:hypothetical protein